MTLQQLGKVSVGLARKRKEEEKKNSFDGTMFCKIIAVRRRVFDCLEKNEA